MVPSASHLLREVEALSHPARTRHLALLARDAAGDPELAELLVELAGRGRWEARLALTVADVAGDLDHLRRCLDPHDPGLLQAALGPAVRHGLGVDELVALLPDLPASASHPLVRALRQRTTDVADALLAPVRERYGDRVAAAVLVSCSAATVDARIDDLAWAVTSWRALGRRHPGPLLAHVDRELAGLPRGRSDATVSATAPGLAEAARVAPARVLDVLEKAGDGIDLSRSGPFGVVLPGLARHDRGRVARLLTAHGSLRRHRRPRPPGRRLWRALAVLGDDELQELVAADRGARLGVVRAAAPARRATLLATGTAGASPLVADDLALLDLLPWWERHAQAALLLSSVVVARDPDRARELTARLPWSDAEPELRRDAHGPRAEDRAAAYPLLVHAAAATRDPAVVEELLGGLDRLSRERDPVRAPAVVALASLPPELLTEAAAAGLAELLGMAVQAADVSWSTQRAVPTWAIRMVGAGVRSDRPGWVEAGVTALRGAADHLGDLPIAVPADLPDGAVPHLVAALADRLDHDGRHGRHDVLLDLVGALGPHAWDDGDLQRRLRRATTADDRATAERAVGLWLAAPHKRDDRVARLLRRDRSVFVLDPVATVLATRGTDLLDLVLGRRLRGRFAARGAHGVPLLGRHTRRWTPQQGDLYADDLRAVVADDGGVDAWERATALRELALLPGTTEDLRRALDDPLPQLADTALRAIADVDRPGSVLADLLDRTIGDRAHVAATAAGHLARRVPPRDLVEPLRAALSSGRVTARKEVCRLLVGLRVPGGVDLAVAVVDDRAQHRDVRRAAAIALRTWLGAPAVADVLDRAAHDPEVGPALAEVRPDDVAPRYRPVWAGLVLVVARHDDPDVAGGAEQALQTWVPWDTTGALVDHAVELVVDLDSRSGSWRPGVGTVLADLRHRGATTPALQAVVARLVALHATRDLDGELDAGVERDLPARHRLTSLALELSSAVSWQPELTQAAAEVVPVLAAQPLLLDLAATAAEAAVPWWGEGAARLEALHAWAALGPVAVAAVRHEPWGLAPARRLTDERVEAAVAALRSDGDAGSGLVAVLLLASRDAWTSSLRADLRALRRHDDPTVRLAAAQVATAWE